MFKRINSLAVKLDEKSGVDPNDFTRALNKGAEKMRKAQEKAAAK